MQLVGRTLSSSKPLEERPYSTFRFHLPFETGPLFYATYNIRLFFHLLFNSSDLLFSNDLDTLLPNYLVAKLKRVDLIYDSHELFSEVPEIQNRPKVKGVWKWLEKTLLPRVKNMMTVNRSIAKTYKNWYGVNMAVHRNLPLSKPESTEVTRKELDLPEDKKIIVLQGAGINVDRGAEEAVLAMRHIEEHLLLIIGSGDVLPTLKQMVQDHHLNDRVRVMGRLPYDEMMRYTSSADLGLSLDKDTNMNYRFSLPNKLFDYIQAGTPVLVSNLPELQKIVEEHGVGVVSDSHEPKQLAGQIRAFLNDSKMITAANEACKVAAKELIWEKERKVLDDILDRING